MHDPIGPGTRAWNAYDLYVDALRQQSQKYIATRRAYLKRELRKGGASESTITEWLNAAIQAAKEPK
jgi:hypothetical protein